jgi:CDP-diacylglycerol--serine O-phosphatidyltransferase
MICFSCFPISSPRHLMVSTWPTFSGKALGRKASRLMLLPPVALAALLVLGLLRWPRATLLTLAILYVATLPLSNWRHGVLRARGTGPEVQPVPGHGARHPNPIAR